MNSKLQIISGKFRGRKLRLSDDARPTQNRAREALFNMLSSGILEPDKKYCAWDAFAGSGALGIEFLSRYVNSEVVFTDISDISINAIKKNLSDLGVENVATVKKCDALELVSKYLQEIDVVFLDPPYDNSYLGKVFLEKAEKCGKVGTVVIWEQEASSFVVPSDKWAILRDKTYGRARFLIIQLKDK